MELGIKPGKKIGQILQKLLEEVLEEPDKNKKEYRPVTYKDIVILTRSVQGWADILVSTLMEKGIPAHAVSRTGYFETYEISILMDYLRILDNERQDLPLAAVLTSPCVGLHAKEMAKIKTT